MKTDRTVARYLERHLARIMDDKTCAPTHRAERYVAMTDAICQWETSICATANETLVQELQDFGMTEHEARVYLDSLYNGENNA